MRFGLNGNIFKSHLSVQLTRNLTWRLGRVVCAIDVHSGDDPESVNRLEDGCYPSPRGPGGNQFLQQTRLGGILFG
jgi:hypothetical protein